MRTASKKLATRVAAASIAITACVMTLAPTTAQAAASVNTTIDTTPIGTWKGTVQHVGGAGNVTLTFVPGGRACLASDAGGAGGGAGVGTWISTGVNTFSYRILERSFDGTGTTVGFVDINQNAVQKANTFTSSGTSGILDANGVLVGSAEATVNATRVPGFPLCC